MEDYEEDMLYISTKLNLIPLLQNITQVLNETPGKKASSAKRIKHYMSQLSHEQRQKLYYFYKIDFEMFEYDHEFVYDCAFYLRSNCSLYCTEVPKSVDLQFPSFLPLPPSTDATAVVARAFFTCSSRRAARRAERGNATELPY